MLEKKAGETKAKSVSSSSSS